MRQDKWDVFGRSIAQKMTLLFEGKLSAPYIRHVKNRTCDSETECTVMKLIVLNIINCCGMPYNKFLDRCTTSNTGLFQYNMGKIHAKMIWGMSCKALNYTFTEKLKSIII